MKLFSLLFLLTLISCGNIEQPKDDANSQTPELVDATPKIMANDDQKSFNRIMAVCHALRAKEDYLRDSRNQKIFTVDIGQQDCRGVQSESLNVSSRIYARAGSYKFETIAFPGFLPIPAVEARNDGLLEEICDKNSSMISPMPINDTDATALVYTSFDNYERCSSDDETKACLYIARGNYSADKKTIKLNEQHVIEFKLTGPERGFYSTRRLMRSCNNTSNKMIDIQIFK